MQNTTTTITAATDDAEGRLDLVVIAQLLEGKGIPVQLGGTDEYTTLRIGTPFVPDYDDGEPVNPGDDEERCVLLLGNGRPLSQRGRETVPAYYAYPAQVSFQLDDDGETPVLWRCPQGATNADVADAVERWHTIVLGGFTYNEHTNDSEAWCPWSHGPAPAPGTDADDRCPQGCAASSIEHDHP